MDGSWLFADCRYRCGHIGEVFDMKNANANGSGLKVLVCVKQVPGSNNVKVDEKTGLLVRPKVGNKLNPYDLFALEEALKLGEEPSCEVGVLTMGPPQAKESLLECLWMGCDKAYLASDRAFGGADVLATSYTLYQSILRAGTFDLIFCGKQTTDGDTAQVGAELAEHLGIPHISNVIEIVGFEEEDANGGSRSIVVKAMQENLIVTQRLGLPCLICFDGDINTPRLPSYRRKKSVGTGEDAVKVFTLADMNDKDASHYGLKGSATQVQRIFPPEKNTDRVLYDGSSEELANRLESVLRERRFIQEPQR